MKRVFTAILLCMMMLVLPAASFAASSASLSFSGETEAYAGETFSVLLTFKASEEFSTLQADFTYDDDLLTFVADSNIIHAEKGAGSISDTPHGDEVTYSLTFRAKKTGKADLDITRAELISSATGKRIGNPAGSAEIEITEAPAVTPDPEASAAPEELIQPTPSQKPADVHIPEGQNTIVIENKKYILMEKTLPEGYRLLGDEQGQLWLWVTGSGQLTEYRTAQQHTLYSYPQQPELRDVPQREVVFPDGMTRLLYASETEGIYYVYLQDHTGESRWYRYDEEDQTLQQAIVEQVIVEETLPADATQQLLDTVSLILLVGIIVAALILLIVIFRRKRP